MGDWNKGTLMDGWGVGKRVDYYEVEDGVEYKELTGTIIGPGPIFTHVMVRVDPVSPGGCAPEFPLPISRLRPAS